MSSNKPGNMRGTRPPPTRASEDATANSPTQPPSTSDEPTAPSLASRVQSSAAGLARSAFQGGGSSDLAQTLASATEGKAGGSSASAGGQLASRDVTTSARGSASAGGYAGSDPSYGVAESFRNEGTSATGGFMLPGLTEEEFQGGDAYTDDVGVSLSGRGNQPASQIEIENENTAPGQDTLQGTTGSWKGKHRAHDPVQLEYNTAWERAEHDPALPQTTHEPVPTDGAAVVSLLSSASFDPNFDPSTDDLDLDPNASPAPLTASEMEALNSFRRQLDRESSAEPQHQTQQRTQGLSPFSLVPDIDTFLQQNDPAAYTPTHTIQPVDTTTNTVTSKDSTISLRDNVLTHLPGAADWIGVQDRYHDEVWGYLRPALEAAQAEMEEREEGEGEEGRVDGPAVRRLKMILKHMRA